MYVVDASVALKWFLYGESFAAESSLLVQYKVPMIAPDVIVAEVANAAWKSSMLGRITHQHAREIAGGLHRFLMLLVPSSEVSEKAVEIAQILNHPVYDCLYLALADNRGCQVITSDQRFIGRVKNTEYEKILVHVSSISDSSF